MCSRWIVLIPKGFLYYDLNLKRIRVSRNVVFLEHIYCDASISKSTQATFGIRHNFDIATLAEPIKVQSQKNLFKYDNEGKRLLKLYLLSLLHHKTSNQILINQVTYCWK